MKKQYVKPEVTVLLPDGTRLPLPLAVQGNADKRNTMAAYAERMTAKDETAE